MKMRLLLLLGGILGSLSLSFLLPTTSQALTTESYRAPLTIVAGDFDAGEGGFGDFDEDAQADEEAASTCAVEGIGWIVCPLANEVSKVVDASYGVVAKLLEVQPLVSTREGATTSIYNAWVVMRNFANVAFVIAFLIIIFSQITSFGLNNYGIKKMLPRLIVAAILVNVSFWICAIAVDVSNILGTSLNGLFQGITNQSVLAEENDRLPIGDGVSWQGITALILAGTVALYIGLSALLPALIAVAFAIVTVFFVLILRQVLLILLIVISPLAFVAYLLPNTESLFKKWMGLFRTLLLMFPIIAMIFGASALASSIIMETAAEMQESDYQIAIQIAGALAAVIPLAITPIVMKTAGGLLNRIGGTINNPNKGPFDRMRKGAEGYRKNREQLRELKAMNGVRTLPGKGEMTRAKVRRGAVLASREAGLKDAKTNYVAQKASENVGDNVFAKQMAGGGRFVSADKDAKNAVVASALSQQKKAFADDVSNMEALIKVKFKDDPGKALREALEGDGDEVQAVAAQNLLFKSGGGGVSKFRTIIEENEASDSKGLANVADTIRGNITENHGQYAKQKGADIIQWASGGAPTLTQATTNRLSDNDLAAQHSDSIEKTVRQGNVTQEQANRMLTDPRVSANLDDKQKAALRVAVATGPTDGTTTQAQASSTQTTSAGAQPAVNTPPAPSQPPTIQVQQAPSAPGQLNIDHINTPPPTVNVQQAPQPPQQQPQWQQPTGASPANSRTSMPPNTGNINQQRDSGLWVEPKDRQ